MDPVSAFSSFASDWGPAWGLAFVEALIIAWLVREVLKMQRETLHERAKSRQVVAQLVTLVRQLNERLRYGS